MHTHTHRHTHSNVRLECMQACYMLHTLSLDTLCKTRSMQLKHTQSHVVRLVRARACSHLDSICDVHHHHARKNCMMLPGYVDMRYWQNTGARASMHACLSQSLEHIKWCACACAHVCIYANRQAII